LPRDVISLPETTPALPEPRAFATVVDGHPIGGVVLGGAATPLAVVTF
jgi:hypothetical protein